MGSVDNKVKYQLLLEEYIAFFDRSGQCRFVS